LRLYGTAQRVVRNGGQVDRSRRDVLSIGLRAFSALRLFPPTPPGASRQFDDGVLAREVKPRQSGKFHFVSVVATRQPGSITR
jgi:hypothetical protein